MEQTHEDGAVLRAMAAGRACVKDGGDWRVSDGGGGTPVSSATMMRLERAELVAIGARGVRLTETGRAWAAREAAPGAPNRNLVQKGRAGTTPVMENLNEPPLAWLLRRGKISARQFAGGERLRGDYVQSNRAPGVTMRWDGMPRGGGGAAGPGAGLDPTQAQIAARRRFDAATAAAGPGLADVLLRVACEGQGLEVAERSFGWPARAGKVVLGLALDRVAAYYGLYTNLYGTKHLTAARCCGL